MKIGTIVVLIISSLIGLALPAQRQGAIAAPGPGIPGILDPRTGEFKPMIQRPLSEGVYVTTSTGKLVYKFTITVSSTLPSGDTISCLGFASLFDSSTGNSIFESAAVAALRSGSTATCTVAIPYSWKLGSASTDMVTLDYDIIVPFGGTTPLPDRSSDQSIATIHVPASGTTTTEIITATI